MRMTFQSQITPFTVKPDHTTHMANSPVMPDRFVTLTLSYKDFSGATNQGNLVCLDVVAEDVITIFKALYDAAFPIASLASMDVYDYDDHASMDANNTSCFNPRLIEGSTLLSLHAYGLAIDVNPIQNPFVIIQENGVERISPEAGRSYIENYGAHTGQMTENEIRLFKSHGFTEWGGEWRNPVDLHHFQAPRYLAHLLSEFSPEEGKQVWAFHKQKAPLLTVLEPYLKDITDLYRAQGSRFFQKLWSYVTKAHTIQECDRYVHQLILHAR